MGISIHGHHIPSIFGDGLLGKAMNGLIRIPAFLANCAAVMVIGELAIRGLQFAVGSIGICRGPEGDNRTWVDKITGPIGRAVNEFRPYADRERYSTGSLFIRLIAFTAISIFATELARILAGATPGIYNKVLTVLGPLRLDSGAWLTNVRALFGA